MKHQYLGAGIVMNNRSFAPLTLRSVAFRGRSHSSWLSGNKFIVARGKCWTTGLVQLRCTRRVPR
jgi:hypothetical protein